MRFKEEIFYKLNDLDISKAKCLFVANDMGKIGLMDNENKKSMLDLYKEGIIAHIQIHDELDLSVESPEQVKKIIDWFNKKKSLDFQTEEGLVGGASYEKYKKPITDEVFYKALESEAVILGAVGGPKWDNLEFSKRPERALLKLRKE